MVRITDGKIVRIYGGLPGSIHDLSLYQYGGAKNFLIPGQHVLADKGYKGDATCIIPFIGRPENLDPLQLEFNVYLAKYRVLIERVILRLKVFKCLSTPFRHPLWKHPIMFETIAQIVNIDLKYRPLLKHKK
jgi:hypothetical protein